MFNSSPPSATYIHTSMNQVSTGSDNDLSPIWDQAINKTNAGLLSTKPLGTNFSEICIKIQIFPFMKMHLKMLSAKWQPLCSGGDELNFWHFEGFRLYSEVPGSKAFISFVNTSLTLHGLG